MPSPFAVFQLNPGVEGTLCGKTLLGLNPSTTSQSSTLAEVKARNSIREYLQLRFARHDLHEWTPSTLLQARGYFRGATAGF